MAVNFRFQPFLAAVDFGLPVGFHTAAAVAEVVVLEVESSVERRYSWLEDVLGADRLMVVVKVAIFWATCCGRCATEKVHVFVGV